MAATESSGATTPKQAESSSATSSQQASSPHTLVASESTQSLASLTLSDDLAVYPYEDPLPSRTLIDILDAVINAYPSALAIDDGTSRLTYIELSQQINIKSDELREAGVSRGDRVGVRLTSGSLNLYASILAVLSVGAAYVPVDVDDPNERAELVWSEARVCVALTDDGLVSKRQSQKVESANRPGMEDDAWIIFTSGSTGKPKGVAVTHRSAAAFVDAETKLFLPDEPLRPGDRVLAGLSVAFDASCEEMWLAWAHGACLVPAPRSLVKAGAELGAFLTAQNISVVSTVPTLAAMWPAEALSRIRLLILGGEACPPELADRLANSVATVWNTYGPTEATVVTCAARIVSKKPVAIGLPLAGWKMAVVGPNGRAVHWGEEGELIIGGAGVARYLDPEKDKTKFRPLLEFGGERAYHSGDLVRAEREGLFFVGRNDEQIKFGGRRIELGEIEAALLTLPGVSAAACTIQRSELGAQVLVGYTVRDYAADPKDRDLLRGMLPPSLVPLLATVDHIPVRTSGKVDKKALPWPLPDSITGSGQARGGSVGMMSEQWRRVLGVSPSNDYDSNFFDLGGTSLGAAQLVSQLRERCPSLSVADVYENPSLNDMAARFDDLAGTTQESRKVKPTPRWTFLVQLPILFLELLFAGLRLLATVLLTKKLYSVRLGATSWALQHDFPWWATIVLFVLFITMPGRLLVTTISVRLCTIKIAPGTYPRGGLTHIRLWVAERFVDVGGIGAIAGTVWCRMYARLLGCRVEDHVQLHALPPTTGLGTFGRGCAVEPEVDLNGWWLDGDVLHVGTVAVEDGARIGTRSILMPNTVVQAFANVPSGVCVRGTVSSQSNLSQSHAPEMTSEPFWTQIRHTLTLLLLDLLPVVSFAPVWGLAAALTPDYNDLGALLVALLKVTVPGAVLGILLYAAVIIILVRLASLMITSGRYPWHGRAAWGAWLIRALMLDARTLLFPIYASLLTPTWLRLLGAKIGRNVEISTTVPIPCLLEVGDSGFLADDVLLSPYELEGGQIRIGITRIGVKTFIGNTGLVSAGVDVPDNVLVGVHGTAPTTEQIESGSTWLGRPPMSLPRQAEVCADSKRTFEPSIRLKIARALIESCRLVPMVILGTLTTAVGLGMLYLIVNIGIGWTVLATPGLFLGATIAACVITTLAKWLLTPCIDAGQQFPLWSHFVWRNELADTFVQSLALPYIRPFFGTPLLCLWMRSLGAKIGHGVWLESHHLPEAELVRLGAGATLNRRCVTQTHLFHDRLLRLDKVCLEAGATLGPNAIALPGTNIGHDVTVGPISLVMRGEHLPGGTRWLGNPVRPWTRGPWNGEESDDDGQLSTTEKAMSERSMSEKLDV